VAFFLEKVRNNIPTKLEFDKYGENETIFSFKEKTQN
jgi:hypothetical protein